MLVTGSLDNTLKMWQLRTHELLYSVKSEEWVWRGDVTTRRKSAFREAAIRVLVTNGYQIDPLLVALGAVCEG